mmetsp:Transcript_32514/g.58216  ORF Transcript_32514/g.58216 Transcript_32514/m.58216 type:complete len:204 (+) Transcript_32514:1542-2153(+)
MLRLGRRLALGVLRPQLHLALLKLRRPVARLLPRPPPPHAAQVGRPKSGVLRGQQSGPSRVVAHTGGHQPRVGQNAVRRVAFRVQLTNRIHKRRPLLCKIRVSRLQQLHESMVGHGTGVVEAEAGLVSHHVHVLPVRLGHEQRERPALRLRLNARPLLHDNTLYRAVEALQTEKGVEVFHIRHNFERARIRLRRFPLLGRLGV